LRLPAPERVGRDIVDFRAFHEHQLARGRRAFEHQGRLDDAEMIMK